MKKLLFLIILLMFLIGCSSNTDERYMPEDIFGSANIWNLQVSDVESDKTYRANQYADNIYIRNINFLDQIVASNFEFNKTTRQLQLISCQAKKSVDAKKDYEALCKLYDEKFNLISRTYSKTVGKDYEFDALEFSLSDIYDNVADDQSSYWYESCWGDYGKTIEARLSVQNDGDAVWLIYSR